MKNGREKQHYKNDICLKVKNKHQTKRENDPITHQIPVSLLSEFTSHTMGCIYPVFAFFKKIIKRKITHRRYQYGKNEMRNIYNLTLHECVKCRRNKKHKVKLQTIKNPKLVFAVEAICINTEM